MVLRRLLRLTGSGDDNDGDTSLHEEMMMEILHLIIVWHGRKRGHVFEPSASSSIPKDKLK